MIRQSEEVESFGLPFLLSRRAAKAMGWSRYEPCQPRKANGVTMLQAQSIQQALNSQEQTQIALRKRKNPNVFDVELHLQLKTVYPGKLDFSGEGTFRARKKPEHFHRNSGGWGVNAELLRRFKFKWISITCNGKEYITSKEFLLKFGKRCTYRDYEMQYFLPLELWGIDAVRAFEKSLASGPKQLKLFERAEAA